MSENNVEEFRHGEFDGDVILKDRFGAFIPKPYIYINHEEKRATINHLQFDGVGARRKILKPSMFFKPEMYADHKTWSFIFNNCSFTGVEFLDWHFSNMDMSDCYFYNCEFTKNRDASGYCAVKRELEAVHSRKSTIFMSRCHVCAVDFGEEFCFTELSGCWVYMCKLRPKMGQHRHFQSMYLHCDIDLRLIDFEIESRFMDTRPPVYFEQSALLFGGITYSRTGKSEYLAQIQEVFKDCTEVVNATWFTSIDPRAECNQAPSPLMTKEEYYKKASFKIQELYAQSERDKQAVAKMLKGDFGDQRKALVEAVDESKGVKYCADMSECPYGIHPHRSSDDSDE
jgi:hypothetical protein